jgi:hypothetical protein
MPLDMKPPFKFDVSGIVKRFRKLPISVDGIAISIPFVSMTVKPDDLERRVAREIVIRLADRRVLSSKECCDAPTLWKLKERFSLLSAEKDRNKAGLALEQLLNELFEAFDLWPRQPYRVNIQRGPPTLSEGPMYRRS